MAFYCFLDYRLKDWKERLALHYLSEHKNNEDLVHLLSDKSVMHLNIYSVHYFASSLHVCYYVPSYMPGILAKTGKI